MNRCTTTSSAAASWPAPAGCRRQRQPAGPGPGPALGRHAQLPPTAQFGELTVTIPRSGHQRHGIRTTPGFRLFSRERSLVFASNYAGQKLLVGYVIEPQTQGLHTAWILTLPKSRNTSRSSRAPCCSAFSAAESARADRY
jgi:hypothetical protein